MGWEFQERGRTLAAMYDKEEQRFLAAAAASSSLTDSGHLGSSPFGRPATAASAGAARALSASLASLRARPRAVDPIIGALPEHTVETRDWVSTAHGAHRPLPLARAGAHAGCRARTTC